MAQKICKHFAITIDPMEIGKLDLSRVRAIFFDVDGTLRDTDDHYVTRFNSMLRPFRFLFRNQNTLPAARGLVMAIEDPVNDIFGLADRFGIDGPLQRLVEFVSSENAGKPDYRVVPGTEPAIKALAGRYPLAVITVRGAKGTNSFLMHSELASYFKCVASGQTVRLTKPFPDQLLWAAQTLGVDPQACVMVGDTTVDMMAGKAAGAQTIGVLSGFGTEKELNVAGADLILASVAEIPELLGLS